VLAALELLKTQIDKNPEVLQSLFAPKAQRNFDAEIKEHYAKRPDDFDPAKLSVWEYEKDKLNAERMKAETQAQVESAKGQAEMEIHNQRVGQAAGEKYVASKKVSESDFEAMTQWIVKNINCPGGKAPVNAYDTAYRELFLDRYERDIRADATKRTVASVTKATSGGADAGLTQRTAPPSPQEADDRDFISAVKEQSKGKYSKL